MSYRHKPVVCYIKDFDVVRRRIPYITKIFIKIFEMYNINFIESIKVNINFVRNGNIYMI